ncbi:MAG: S9 family peptidase [Deltaproteobacteria bacterium]|nr:S9 family peptidase [Deltaproteobacteria bacterium]
MRFFSIVVAILFLFETPTRAREPITIDDLVGLKILSDPQISPAGDRIAYVVSVTQAGKGPNSDIWMVSANGGTAVQYTSNPGRDAYPRWNPKGDTIAFLSARPGEDAKTQIYLISTNGGEARCLTAEADSIEALAWSPDGDSIAYSLVEAKQDPSKVSKKKASQVDSSKANDQSDSKKIRHRRLKIIELSNKKTRMISPAGVSVFNFAFSPDSKQLAVFFASDPSPNQGYWNARLVVIDITGATIKELANQVGSSKLAYSPSGRQIAFLSPRGKHKLSFGLSLVPASGGQVKPLCPEHQGSIWDFAWRPDGKSLILWGHQSTEGFLGEIAAQGGKVKVFFDAALRAWGSPALSLSNDGRWFAYRGENPGHPSEVFIASYSKKPLPGRRLTITNPEIEKRILGKLEPFSWKAKDGTSIHGVLVHPAKDPKTKNAPTIVMVHGGPQWQWWRGWMGSWHEPAQLLAARGYRVLLPNPRGSTGRGEKFAYAAQADWGGIDFHDIIAGVDALIKAGLSDPDRLGIIGWSYGGYMTAWTITRTMRFKAAVAGAAVTNLLSMHGTCDISLFLPDQFEQSPYQEPQIFLERSPVFWVHQASTPTLVVHGENDVRVPVSQGRELHQALKDAGVTTRLITFPREGHGFSEPGHQKVLLRETLNWLDKYILKSETDN